MAKKKRAPKRATKPTRKPSPANGKGTSGLEIGLSAQGHTENHTAKPESKTEQRTGPGSILVTPSTGRGKINRWLPGQSGNPSGRAKKLITTMKKEGYKMSQIHDTLRVILSMNKPEIDAIIGNTNHYTVLEVTLASAVSKGIRNGDLSSIETIITRAFGAPKGSGMSIELPAPQVIIAANDEQQKLIEETRAKLNQIDKDADNEGETEATE